MQGQPATKSDPDKEMPGPHVANPATALVKGLEPFSGKFLTLTARTYGTSQHS
jgi:hypothetical protein